jgi:hypothetical protein
MPAECTTTRSGSPSVMARQALGAAMMIGMPARSPTREAFIRTGSAEGGSTLRDRDGRTPPLAWR